MLRSDREERNPFSSLSENLLLSVTVSKRFSRKRKSGFLFLFVDVEQEMESSPSLA